MKNIDIRLKKKLEDALDVNYTVSEIKINTMEEFDEALYSPFLKGSNTFYRGERCCSAKRRLLPTYLRNKESMAFTENKIFSEITSQTLFDFYTGKKTFLSVYETLYGKADINNMYPMLAFAQHYLDISPFIDFTASLYVAMSFALKGRDSFPDDIVIYTAFDIGDDDTTDDINEVNRWLYDYSVGILRIKDLRDIEILARENKLFAGLSPEDVMKNPKKLGLLFEGVLPKAKLIDIPTNDLMKYQQGVFLLLNNFGMMDSAYFTKSVRHSFVIKKFIINKDICPALRTLLREKAPQYKYKCLLDIKEAVK